MDHTNLPASHADSAHKAPSIGATVLASPALPAYSERAKAVRTMVQDVIELFEAEQALLSFTVRFTSDGEDSDYDVNIVDVSCAAWNNEAIDSIRLKTECRLLELANHPLYSRLVQGVAAGDCGDLSISFTRTSVPLIMSSPETHFAYFAQHAPDLASEILVGESAAPPICRPTASMRA